MTKEPAVSDNWRNCNLGIDKNSYETRDVPNEDRLGVATGSRSDPISSTRSYRSRNPSQDSTDKDRNRNSNSKLGHANNRTSVHDNRNPACFFRGSEGPNLSSYRGITSQSEDDEDEATDVVVWKASKEPKQVNIRSHRSLSNTSEPQLSNSDFRRSYLLQRGKSQESRTSKSPDIPKASCSDENPMEYENQLFAVTQQLEMIKTTQDNILTELSSDISTLQYENIHLKNQNEHLTLKNSHLLQVITDLSKDVELMRQVFRSRGWPLHQEDTSHTRNLADDIERLDYEITNPPSQQNKLKERRYRNSKSKFENISLDSSSSYVPNIQAVGPTGPGDDQISIMANRSRDHGLTKKKERSKSKASKSKRNCLRLRGLFKRKKKRDRRTTEEQRLS